MEKNVTCFYIYLEPYLRQWLINQNGGNEPLDFKKGSIEREFIIQNTKRKGKDEKPDLPQKELTAVVIHNTRGRNNYTYNRFPQRAKEELKAMLKRRFDWKMMMDILSVKNHGKLLSEMIYEWMENNGIEQDERNYNAIVKRFQRRRVFYGLKFNVKNRKTKKKN